MNTMEHMSNLSIKTSSQSTRVTMEMVLECLDLMLSLTLELDFIPHDAKLYPYNYKREIMNP